MSYLYGEMTGQEKNLFEKELKTNQDLFNELKLHHELDNAILKEIQVKKFRNTLESIHQSTFKPKTTRVFNLQNKYFWAAASITAFSGTAIYTLSKQANNTDRLYNKYYEVWQPAFITRGVTTESDLELISTLFEQKQFEQVISHINQLNESSKISPKIKLIHGCSLMETEQFSLAIEVFCQFDTDDYTIYTETAQWYKALSYLKNKEPEQAIKSLKLIINYDNTYALEARELLKKMN